MKIAKFDEKFIGEMTKLYKDSYSEFDPKHQWNFTKAKESLEVCFKAIA